MHTFQCSYLNGEVELSDERERHITSNHPDLLPDYLAQVGLTLAEPDQVQRSLRMSAAHMFCRQFEEVRQSKYIVVVVVSESTPMARHWIITAYITRRLANGEVEWRKI